jgi:hypothetical protein
MGRPKLFQNGDSKIIYDAIKEITKSTSEIRALVATNSTKIDERHDSNLRALENMSGDMHIVLNKVQNLPCGATQAEVKANGTHIKWLWGLFSAIVVAVIIAFVKG